MAESRVEPGWDAHVHVFDAAAPARRGHYAPPTRSLDEIEAVGGRHGVGHFVLVQPSVYGSDNSLLVRALSRQPARHRGVVVVEAEVRDDELDAMHALGVRGARFNLVSPVGNGGSDFEVLAPRLRERGWHAQWYAPSNELPRLVHLQRTSGLTFVLDHLAGITAQSAPADWQAVTELARNGTWVKFSGWYRLGAREPYGALVPLIARAAEVFGDRIVWGSDWPHTSLHQEPPYDSLLQPVRAALGGAFIDSVLREFPVRLYSTTS